MDPASPFANFRRKLELKPHQSFFHPLVSRPSCALTPPSTPTMKLPPAQVTDLLKASAFVKVITFAVFSLSFLFILNHYAPSYPLLTFSTSDALNSSSIASVAPEKSPLPPPRLKKVFPMPSLPVVERMGVIDENGVMTEDFKIGDYDPTLVGDLGNLNETEEVKEKETGVRIRVEKYKICEQSMTDYIPCLDNVEVTKRLNSTERGEMYERHCPEEGKGLNCLVPMPKGYRIPILWPKSRDEVLFAVGTV